MIQRARAASRRVVSALLITFATSLLSASALAAPWTPRAPSEQPPAQAEIDEASRRYQKGIRLYDVEGDVQSALVELQRAYDIAPNYVVLFNIGQVARTARDYPTSLRAFEAYLKYGGADIPAEKRQTVEAEVKALEEQLVSKITITSNATVGTVYVNGSEYGSLPLADGILVNPGNHRVELRTADGTATKSVSITGGEKQTIDLTIRAPILVPEPKPTPLPPPTPAPEVEKGPSYVWAGWLVTGLFTAGAITTGTIALVDRSDLDDTAYFGAAAPLGLEDQRSRVRALAITTDVLIGAAALSAGVSLYFTIRESSSSSSTDEAAPSAGTTALRVSPTGLSLDGTF